MYFHEIAQELKLHMDPNGRAGEFVKRLVRDCLRDPMTDEEQEADYLGEYNPMEKNISIGFALDVCFFFQQQSLRSIKRTLDSLVLMTKIQMFKTKNKETKSKMKEALEKIQELRDSLSAGAGGIM